MILFSGGSRDGRHSSWRLPGCCIFCLPTFSVLLFDCCVHLNFLFISDTTHRPVGPVGDTSKVNRRRGQTIVYLDVGRAANLSFASSFDS